MGERTKATDTKHIRQEILERDNYNCVGCGTSQALTIAHVFVNRSHGGLAVKENLCVLCMDCHHQMDNGKKHEQDLMRLKVQSYMMELYGIINIKKLKYYKWE
mgnify:FL=1